MQLTQTEREMLAFAKANCDSVVVICNFSNIVEIAELENDDDINAILWWATPGAKGFQAMTEVLVGDVNPSRAPGQHLDRRSDQRSHLAQRLQRHLLQHRVGHLLRVRRGHLRRLPLLRQRRRPKRRRATTPASTTTNRSSTPSATACIMKTTRSARSWTKCASPAAT